MGSVGGGVMGRGIAGQVRVGGGEKGRERGERRHFGVYSIICKKKFILKLHKQQGIYSKSLKRKCEKKNRRKNVKKK